MLHAFCDAQSVLGQNYKLHLRRFFIGMKMDHFGRSLEAFFNFRTKALNWFLQCNGSFNRKEVGLTNEIQKLFDHNWLMFAHGPLIIAHKKREDLFTMASQITECPFIFTTFQSLVDLGINSFWAGSQCLLLRLSLDYRSLLSMCNGY